MRGSLPRLRYGRSYWLRARAVDLAGNSLDPQDHDFGPERPDLHAQPFLRYEPVAAPIVALVRREDGTTERPFEGESMLRMAIRSRNDTPADNAVPSPETARRFAVPSQVSAREAEQHGMLDDGGRVSSATFQMLANERDRDALDPDAALVEETIAMQGPLDAAPVDTTFAAYRDGLGLTHLPDPLALAAGARIVGHPDADPEEVIPISLYADGTAWPDALPFKVEVVRQARREAGVRRRVAHARRAAAQGRTGDRAPVDAARRAGTARRHGGLALGLRSDQRARGPRPHRAALDAHAVD